MEAEKRLLELLKSLGPEKKEALLKFAEGVCAWNTLTSEEKDKNKYCCENDTCPVVFVRSPSNPHRRKVVFVSSVKESVIRKFQEATAQEIVIARSLPLSYD